MNSEKSLREMISVLANKLEFTFEYKGYKCFVIFNSMGYRCGYVELTKGDKYYERNFNKIPVACHRGLTWSSNYIPGVIDRSDRWYIGFDCGHTFDGIDLETYRKLYDEELSLLVNNERDLIVSSVVTTAHVKSDYPIQTIEYVENELKYIVDQLLSESRSDTITDIIDIFGNMRETSKEENKAIQQALDKISSPTGLNLFDFVKGDDRNF